MTTLKQKLEHLPVERREEVESRAAQLIAEEMTLRDLRQALNLTQEKMAELLEIRQESVSHLESRTDLLLSTLKGYVKAMGGELRLVVDFPDRQSVILSDLSSLEDKTD